MIKNKLIKFYLMFGVILFSVFNTSCCMSEEYLIPLNQTIEVKLNNYGHQYFYDCIYSTGFPEHVDYKLLKTSIDMKEHFKNRNYYLINDNFLEQIDNLDESKIFNDNYIFYFASCIFSTITNIEINTYKKDKDLMININIYKNINPNLNLPGSGDFIYYFMLINKEKVNNCKSIKYQMTYSEYQ